MSTSSEEDCPSEPPSFQEHFYKPVRVSLQVAGDPDSVVVPGCCGAGAVVGAGGAVSAEVPLTYDTDRVVVGEGCDVVLN